MGRYDKIKVKYDGKEYTPRDIQVYRDGRAVSLGNHEDTSVNTTVRMQTSNGPVDILKHPVLRTTPAVYKACNHVIMGYPENGFCFNPCNKFKYGYSYIKDNIKPFWFQGFISKDSDEDVIVFESYRKDDPNRQYYRITWQADGYIRVDIGAKEPNNPNCYGSKLSSRPFGRDTVCWLDTYCTANSYNNFGICFATEAEFNAWGGKLGGFTTSWSYMTIRAGGNNGADGAASGATKFNLGWLNANATNCLGDYWGAVHGGGSRLRFHNYVWVGGSQLYGGQQELFICAAGRGDSWKLRQCYVLEDGKWAYKNSHTLDPVLANNPESHYEWE